MGAPMAYWQAKGLYDDYETKRVSASPLKLPLLPALDHKLFILDAKKANVFERRRRFEIYNNFSSLLGQF